MKYRAFANGQEIEDFPINGVNTEEIYGGNTLFWKKEDGKLPMKEICGARATYYWTSDTSLGYQKFHEVELSVRNQTEDGSKYIADNTKCGVYLMPDNSSSSIWTTYSYTAYILFDGHTVPGSTVYDSIRNVKMAHKIYDMDGNLLETNESWTYSTRYDDNIEGVYQIGFGNGIILATNSMIPIDTYASGSGEFSSYDELKKYFGVS